MGKLLNYYDKNSWTVWYWKGWKVRQPETTCNSTPTWQMAAYLSRLSVLKTVYIFVSSHPEKIITAVLSNDESLEVNRILLLLSAVNKKTFQTLGTNNDFPKSRSRRSHSTWRLFPGVLWGHGGVLKSKQHYVFLKKLSLKLLSNHLQMHHEQNCSWGL